MANGGKIDGMLKCPKCGHPRSAAAADPAVCSACGLVFAKWVQRVLGQERVRRRDPNAEPDGAAQVRLKEILLPAPGRVDATIFYGRCLLFVLFVVWGLYFISLDLRTNAIGESFMHRINLVFHEAGHVLFMPFGHFTMVLGGTLGQLLMPAIAGGALLLKNRDAFGASLALWWLGQSVMDTAPYINDARDLQLMLLGGGTGADKPGMHDWENLLLDLGMIEHERGLALAADRLGECLLLLGLVWGALALRRQYVALKDGGGGD
jgi:hypothetical protein